MSNTIKTILVFTLIIAIIAWLMGYINFNQEDYKNYTFQEQAQVIGSQFNNAIKKSTEAIKKISDTAMNVFKMIGEIISTVFNGLEKIANFFGFGYSPGASGGGSLEDGFQGNGGFGGGGGSTW